MSSSAYGAWSGYDLIARAGGTRSVGMRRSRQAVLSAGVREALFDATQNAVRNDIEARAAIRRVQQYVIGATGPRVESNTGDPGLDEQLDEIYAEWSIGTGDFRCDVSGLRSFPAMLRGVMEEWFVGGRCGLLRIDTPEFDGSLQEIESRRFMNPSGSLDGDRLIAGVELSGPGGRVVAYHVAQYQLGGMTLSLTTDRIAAADMLYLMQPLDAPMGVVAPEPIIGVGTRTIGQIAESLSATTTATATGALAPFAIKRGMESGDLGPGDQTDGITPGFNTDDEGKPVFNMLRNALGNFIDLAPGDELVNLRQEFPSAALKPLIDIQTRRVSMLIGMPVHVLTLDFDMTLSSARMAMQSTRSVRDTFFEALVRHVVRPARAHMIDAALRLGLIDPPASDAVDLYAFKASPPLLPDPDPDKTMQTQGFALSRGMTTMTKYLADQNIEIAEHLATLRAEKKLFAEAGIPHPTERDDSGEDAQIAEPGEEGVGEPRPGESREADGAGGGGPGQNRRQESVR